MGNNSPKAQSQPIRLEKCGGGQHIMASFECQCEDCEMSPIICNKCSYKSKEAATKGKRFCKLCRAAEKMREIEDEDEEIDTTTQNNVKLVSSVAYDKEKRNFTVEGDNLNAAFGEK